MSNVGSTEVVNFPPDCNEEIVEINYYNPPPKKQRPYYTCFQRRQYKEKLHRISEKNIRTARERKYSYCDEFACPESGRSYYNTYIGSPIGNAVAAVAATATQSVCDTVILNTPNLRDLASNVAESATTSGIGAVHSSVANAADHIRGNMSDSMNHLKDTFPILNFNGPFDKDLLINMALSTAALAVVVAYANNCCSATIKKYATRLSAAYAAYKLLTFDYVESDILERVMKLTCLSTVMDFVTPQSGTTTEAVALFKDIAAMFSLSILGKHAKNLDIDAIARDFQQFAAKDNGAECIATRVISLIQRLINLVRTQFMGLGPSPLFDTGVEEVDDFASQIAELHRQKSIGILPMTCAVAMKLETIEAQLKARLRKYTLAKNTTELRLVYTGMLKQIQQLKAPYEVKLLTGNKARIEPLCILMRGGTGCGKTTLIERFMADLMVETCVPSDRIALAKDHHDFIFYFAPENEYQEGYNGQYGVVIDDYMQRIETINSSAPESLMTMRMIGNNPYMMHMAALELKACTYFTSKVVLLNTNRMGDLGAGALFEKSALDRRMHIDTEVTIADQYKIWDDKTNKYKLDHSKLPTDGSMTTESYVFTYVNVLGETITSGYDEYLKYCIVRLDAHNAVGSLRKQQLHEHLDRKVKLLNERDIVLGILEEESEDDDDFVEEEYDYVSPQAGIGAALQTVSIEFMQAKVIAWMLTSVGLPTMIQMFAKCGHWIADIADGMVLYEEFTDRQIRYTYHAMLALIASESMSNKIVTLIDRARSAFALAKQKITDHPIMAVLAAVSMICLIGKYMWPIEDEESPQSDNRTYSVTKPTRRMVTEPRGRHATMTNLRPQSDDDQRLKYVVDSLFKDCMVEVSATNSGVSEILRLGNGIRIGKGVVLMNDHFAAMNTEYLDLKAVDGTTVRKVRVEEPEYFGSLSTEAGVAGDFCFIYCDEFKNDKVIEGYFYSNANIAAFAQSFIVMASVKGGIATKEYGMAHTTNTIDINYPADPKYNREAECITLHNSIRYAMRTIPGDCGSPVLSTTTDYAARIMGIHAGGSGRFGYASVVTAESVREGIALFTTVTPECGDGLYLGKFKFIRKLDKPVFSSNRTVLSKTDMYGKLMTPTVAPAVLGVKDGVDAHAKAALKYAKPLIPVDMATILVAAKVVIDHVTKVGRECMPTDKPRILTFEEVMDGVEGEEYMGSINRKTSAGIHNCPVISKGNWPGKSAFTGFGLKTDYNRPECKWLKKRVEEIHANAAKGIRLEHLDQDTMKDELRGVDKVKEVSSRMISGTPIDYHVAVAMMMKSFVNMCYKGKLQNGMAMGVNPFGQDWATLYALLKMKGDNIIAGDFSNFDGSHWDAIIRALFAQINLWYKGTPEEDAIRNTLMLELTNSKHVYQDIVYEFYRGIPSGHFMTTTINSLINLTLLTASYINHYKLEDADDCDMLKIGREFFDDVYVCVFGDDNIMSVSEGHTSFNQEVLTKQLALFDYKYTNEDKSTTVRTFTSLRNVDFLKRKFLWNGDIGRIMAPLALTSVIERVFYWVRGKNHVQSQLQQNADNSFHELSLHGEVVFNEHAPEMLRVLNEYYAIVPIDVSYRDNILAVSKIDKIEI